MRRRRIEPRPDWRRRVEDYGLYWHTTERGTPYWDESAYWEFTLEEIERIEAATGELYEMCLEAVGWVVDRAQLGEFGYDARAVELIEKSWRTRDWEPTFYARFDLAYDGSELKLLELNGDTPTSLVEAAVVQWFWLQDRFPELDQYNSVHEKLVAAMRLLADVEQSQLGRGERPPPLHFTSVTPHPEDEGTVGYMAACAAEAGFETAFVPLHQIGWRRGADGGQFVDLAEQPISQLFKLCPWEWMLGDAFGPQLHDQVTRGEIRLIEPAWKMAASNKRLLVTLKELFPDSPWLLDASMSEADAAGWGEYVSKPVLGREGGNVSLLRATGGGAEVLARRDGAYADDLFVYQRRARLAEADEGYAVLGSWVVNREPCGLGVREADGPITDDTARFVPHVIV